MSGIRLANLASTPRASGGVRRLFSRPEHRALQLQHSILRRFCGNHGRRWRAGGHRPEEERLSLHRAAIEPRHAQAEFRDRNEHGLQRCLAGAGRNQTQNPVDERLDLGSAVYSPDDGWLDPHSVLMGFRKKARSLGADFIAEEVMGFERTATHVAKVKLKSGAEIKADHFVNAAGAWAKDICTMLGFKVPIEPLRRFEHYFETEEPIEPLPI
ncbi:NAD(P)/FAD-dependent oxidoreductase [Rhizobium rhizogenes]